MSQLKIRSISNCVSPESDAAERLFWLLQSSSENDTKTASFHPKFVPKTRHLIYVTKTLPSLSFWYSRFKFCDKLVIMLVGYMRVSRQEQTTDRQEDHLRQAGCEKIFKDVISGASDKRSGLDEALSYCREGDSFIVWELDRLGRSLKHLIQIVEGLKARGINFLDLKDGINTDSID
jgi:hypothetical protein